MNRRMRFIAPAVVLAVGLGIAGCSSNTNLDAALSTNWQAQVVSIAESTASTDHATALSKLNELEQVVTQARTDGKITAERAAIIQQSIALVRADIEKAVADAAAVTTTETVTEAPADPTPANTDNGNKDKGNKDKGNKDKKKNNSGNNGNGKGN